MMCDAVDGDSVDAKPTQRSDKPSSSTGGTSQVDVYQYNMNYPSMGQCVIINNKNFDKDMKMEKRTGTDVDAGNTMRVFSQLGYKVSVSNDLTVKDIKTLLYNVSKEDHSQSASVVCVLLSYGKEGKVYGTDGAVDLKELTRLFRGDRCSSLVGKPKLFFIQACQIKDAESDIETDSAAEARSTVRIPLEADFLYVYSTAPGYYTGNGSWFIQFMCDMLLKHGKELEITQIMTRVNHKVALEFDSSSDLSEYGEKQIPCIVSLLTKELYFPSKVNGH